MQDAYGEDLRLWAPDSNNPVPDLDVEKSKFLITHVGDQLCDLVQQEKQASQLHMANGKKLHLYACVVFIVLKVNSTSIYKYAFIYGVCVCDDFLIRSIYM